MFEFARVTIVKTRLTTADRDPAQQFEQQIDDDESRRKISSRIS